MKTLRLLFMLTGLMCASVQAANVEIDLSIFWENPMSCPGSKACTGNCDTVSFVVGYNPVNTVYAKGNLHSEDVKTNKYIGPYFGSYNSQFYFGIPKSISPFWDDYKLYFNVVTVSKIFPYRHSQNKNCKDIYGKTSCEYYCCHQYYEVSSGKKGTRSYQTEDMMQWMTRQGVLNLQSFAAIPGVDMQFWDYFDGGKLFVPLHFKNPGKGTADKGVGFHDQSTVLAMINYYDQMYPMTRPSLPTAVVAKDNLGF